MFLPHVLLHIIHRDHVRALPARALHLALGIGLVRLAEDAQTVAATVGGRAIACSMIVKLRH